MGQNNMDQNNTTGQQGAQKGQRDQGIKQAPGQQDRSKDGQMKPDDKNPQRPNQTKQH